MIIEPSVGDSPRNGSAVMMSASRTAATVLPMNVARPPASAAPPNTAAVMLLSVNELPIWALPIGERTITNSAAIGADHAREQRAPHPDPVGPDPAPLGRTVVEADRTHLEPGPRAVQPQIEQPGADRR